MTRPITILIIVALCSGILAGCVEGSPPLHPESVHTDGPASLLLPEGGPAVSVRIHHGPDYSPSRLALDGLNEIIRSVSGKEVQIDHVGPFSLDEHTPAALEAAIQAAREREPPRLGANLALIYVDGPPTRDDAVAFYNGDGEIVVFTHTLDGESPTPVSIRGLDMYEFSATVERSVLVHELGHAYGLVNCGIPMVTAREDPDSRCHSTESDSVMWPGVQSSFYHPDRLLRGDVEPLWHFNENDLADIRAFQAAHSG